MTDQRAGTTRPNEPIIAEFRNNGGRVGGRFADVPLILITTIGAQTGTTTRHRSATFATATTS